MVASIIACTSASVATFGDEVSSLDSASFVGFSLNFKAIKKASSGVPKMKCLNTLASIDSTRFRTRGVDTRIGGVPYILVTH